MHKFNLFTVRKVVFFFFLLVGFKIELWFSSIKLIINNKFECSLQPSKEEVTNISYSGRQLPSDISSPILAKSSKQCQNPATLSSSSAYYFRYRFRLLPQARRTPCSWVTNFSFLTVVFCDNLCNDSTAPSFFFVFCIVWCVSDEDGGRRAVHRLSKPLVGDDGRVYACSDKNFFAFEGNGTIAWSTHLNWTCNPRIAPVHGGRGKVRDEWISNMYLILHCPFLTLSESGTSWLQLYVVAEDRILRIDFSAAESSVEVFFGPEPGQGVENEIIGVATSTLSSSVYFTLKNRGLFAYLTNGELLWSAGPVRNQFGYRQGCRRSPKDCYFASVPVIDYCEAAIYVFL